MMVPKSSPWKLTERALALGLVLFLCAVVAVPLARGQAQANSPEAAFFLGTDPGSGASWPRAQAIAQGFTTTVSVRGGVRQAFLLGSQDRLKASPSRVLGGQWLHLDARGFFDVFASYGEPFAVLDASGRFDLSVLPGARPRGSGIGLQALVTDPTAAPGFTLSGATQVR